MERPRAVSPARRARRSRAASRRRGVGARGAAGAVARGLSPAGAARRATPTSKRRALEKGLSPRGRRATARRAAPLYAMLGELYHHARRERRAEELWLDGRAADPSYWPIALRSGRAGRRARRAVARGRAARSRSRPSTRRSRCCAPRRRWRCGAGGAPRRRSCTRASADAEKDDTDALRELYSFARAEGATAEALAFVDRIARARPDVLQTRARSRRRARGGRQGRRGARGAQGGARRGARRAAAARARRAPAASARPRRRGAAAAARTRSSCARRIRSCAPICWRCSPRSARADLARAWPADVPSLIDARRRADTAGGRPRARALRLGGDARAPQRAVGDLPAARRRDPRRARRARRGAGSTSATRPTRSRSRCARRASTSVAARWSRPRRPAEHDLSEPWYGLYYDVKAQVIEFAALEPGDVIDVEYVVSRRRAAQHVRRLLRRSALPAGGSAARSRRATF